MKFNKLFFDVKKMRFFIPISFFQIMWLPLWEDKSIKQLTISGLATRAPALVIPEWISLLN